MPLLMAVRMHRRSAPEKYLAILKLCVALSFRTARIAKRYNSYRHPAMFRLMCAVAHEKMDSGEA